MSEKHYPCIGGGFNRIIFDGDNSVWVPEKELEAEHALAETLGHYHEAAKAENAKLRELVKGMWYCANEAYGMCARVPVGGERPFTCCPLYDFDAKEYRCEKLMHELGIEPREMEIDKEEI